MVIVSALTGCWACISLCTQSGAGLYSALQRLGLISASLVIALGLWQVTTAPAAGDPHPAAGALVGGLAVVAASAGLSRLRALGLRHLAACWASSPALLFLFVLLSVAVGEPGPRQAVLSAARAAAHRGVVWPGAVLPADAGQLDRL